MSRSQIPTTFVRAIQDLEWYHENCTRHIAESLLMQNGSDGSYLLRPSKNESPYVVSIRCKDSVKHYGLTSNGNQVGFGLATFDNVADFKAHFTKQPFIAGESGLITWLKHPYPSSVVEPALYERVKIHAQLNEPGSLRESHQLAIASKEGYMTKLGGFVRNWKVRWFVLWKSELKYFKQRQDEVPIRTVDLVECSQCMVESRDDKPNCFKLVFPWRTFFLSCDTPSERDEWVQIIEWKLNQMRSQSTM